MRLTTIENEDQKWIDEPVYTNPLTKFTSNVARSVQRLFKSKPPQPEIIGYDRIRLNWMKPDGNGKLIPR